MERQTIELIETLSGALNSTTALHSDITGRSADGGPRLIWMDGVQGQKLVETLLTFTKSGHSLSVQKMSDETDKAKQPQAKVAVFSRKELLEVHKLVVEEVRKMTPEQGFRDLIASGIYTPAGKLAKEYGG